MSETSISARLTVDGAIAAATKRFATARLGAPRREAIHLIAELLDREPAELLLHRADVIEPDRRRWIDRAVERRAAGEPLAYVTGVAGFRHLLIRTDRRGLIPRPETEGLVDRALAANRTGVAVDVGTGTGCIALSLAHEGGYRQVVAVERSAETLALARWNAERTGLGIGLVWGDLTRGLADRSTDVLVSNPPYLSAAEYDDLDSSVRDYEPELALRSGVDGLEATRDVLSDGRRVVVAGGTVVLELAATRAGESAAIAVALGWQDVRVDDDIFGRPRYLTARQGNGS